MRTMKILLFFAPSVAAFVAHTPSSRVPSQTTRLYQNPKLEKEQASKTTKKQLDVDVFLQDMDQQAQDLASTKLEKEIDLLRQRQDALLRPQVTASGGTFDKHRMDYLQERAASLVNMYQNLKIHPEPNTAVSHVLHRHTHAFVTVAAVLSALLVWSAPEPELFPTFLAKLPLLGEESQTAMGPFLDQLSARSELLWSDSARVIQDAAKVLGAQAEFPDFHSLPDLASGSWMMQQQDNLQEKLAQLQTSFHSLPDLSSWSNPAAEFQNSVAVKLQDMKAAMLNLDSTIATVTDNFAFKMDQPSVPNTVDQLSSASQAVSSKLSDALLQAPDNVPKLEALLGTEALDTEATVAPVAKLVSGPTTNSPIETSSFLLQQLKTVTY